MADEPSFPAAADDDSEDVRWALETANAMWGRGEARDALRWLRRAAETASEEEDDMRSVVLATAAADLRNHLEQRGIPHTEFPPPVEDTDDDEIMVDESIPETSPSSPPDVELVGTGDAEDVDEDEDEDGVESEEDAAPTQRTVPPEASAKAPAAPPKRSTPTPGPAVPRPPRTPATPPAKGSSPRPRSVPSRPSRPSRPAKPTDRGGRPPIHAALRVAVAAGSRPGAYQVSVLGPDEHAGAGATEALLVPLDPQTHYE